MLAVTLPHTAVVAVRGGSEVPFRRHACRQQVAKCSLTPICGANRRTGEFLYCANYSLQIDTDSLRLKRPASDTRTGAPREGRRGAGEGHVGRRSAPPVSRAHFFGLFFLHAELQDPQIEKQAKNNTKTGQSIKHVLKQQTEVQFVVFAFLASSGPCHPPARPR